MSSIPKSLVVVFLADFPTKYEYAPLPFSYMLDALTGSLLGGKCGTGNSVLW